MTIMKYASGGIRSTVKLMINCWCYHTNCMAFACYSDCEVCFGQYEK